MLQRLTVDRADLELLPLVICFGNKLIADHVKHAYPDLVKHFVDSDMVMLHNLVTICDKAEHISPEFLLTKHI